MDNIASLFKLDEVSIFSHIYPDGDTIGSQLALAEALNQVGVQVHCYNTMKVPENFSFLKNINWIDKFDREEVLSTNLCFVDCGDFSRTGLLDSLVADKIIFNIDHHKSNSLFGKYNLVSEFSSSTCELIYEVLEKNNIRITESIATALLLGISTDTGSFKYENTTSKTHQIASKLIGFGADTKMIRLNVFENVSMGKFKLLSYVYSNTKILFNGKVSFLSIPKFIEEGLSILDSDYTGISGLIKEIEGVEVSVLLRSVSSNQTKISFRSKDQIDVSKLAESFGGGGHARAAGAISQFNIQETERYIMNMLGTFIDL